MAVRCRYRLLRTQAGFRLFIPEQMLLVELHDQSSKFAQAWTRRLLRAQPQGQSRQTSTFPPELSITACLTSKCNLRCQYCYIHGLHGDFPYQCNLAEKEFNVSTLQAEVAKMLEQKPAEVSVAFFGGEPLLARDKIIKATNSIQALAERTKIPVTFGLTTNGTLLDKEFLHWARTHRLKIMVSIDSPPELHNLYRANFNKAHSFEQLISKLIDFESDLILSTTVSQQTPSLRSALDPLLNRNFEAVSFGLAHTRNPELQLRRSDAARFCRETVEEEAWFYRHRARIKNLRRVHERLATRSARSCPCTAGKSGYALSWDGNRYLCHACLGNPAYRLENITNAQLQKIPAECRCCWAYELCGGNCWL